MPATAAAIIAALLLMAWGINRRHGQKKRRAAWRAGNEREAQRSVDAEWLTAEESAWRIRQGLPMPLHHPSRSRGNSFTPAPNLDAGCDQGRHQDAAASAFWEQQDEHSRRQAVRSEEDERDRQWRDEEDRRRRDGEDREREYWEQRRREDDEYYRRQRDGY